MEARDRLEASRPVIEDFIDKAGDQSNQLLDEAQLQAHLAAMEADDYWERNGRDLTRKFSQSGDEMIRSVTEAVDACQLQLSQWVDSLRSADSK